MYSKEKRIKKSFQIAEFWIAHFFFNWNFNGSNLKYVILICPYFIKITSLFKGKELHSKSKFPFTFKLNCLSPLKKKLFIFSHLTIFKSLNGNVIQNDDRSECPTIITSQSYLINLWNDLNLSDDHSLSGDEPIFILFIYLFRWNKVWCRQRIFSP